MLFHYESIGIVSENLKRDPQEITNRPVVRDGPSSGG